MSRATYNNTLNLNEVSVAIERLLIAPYPTNFTPARVDLDSLPTGFSDLGATVEDTASFKVNRTNFEIKTGIPMVVQYQSVEDLTGTLAISLRSNSWRKVQFALGNYTAVSSSTFIGTISSSVALNAASFTLVSTTGAASLCVGQQIVIYAASQSPDAADAIETRITSIGSDSKTYAIDPAIPTTFATGANIATYAYVQQPVGGRAIKYYSALGVSDFIDGTQVVHQIPKCRMASEWTEEFRPNVEARVPLTLTMFGVQQTINGCTELVIANRFYFPKGCGGCL